LDDECHLTIPENMDENNASSMTYTATANGATVAATLTNAYSAHHSQVVSWTRNLVLDGNVLSVHDVCRIAAGVKPIFSFTFLSSR
jgi:hypothetical protein